MSKTKVITLFLILVIASPFLASAELKKVCQIDQFTDEYCFGRTVYDNQTGEVREITIDTTHRGSEFMLSGAVVAIISHELSHVKNEALPLITGEERPDPPLTEENKKRYQDYRDRVIAAVMEKYGDMSNEELDREFRKLFPVGEVKFAARYSPERKRIMYLSAIISFSLLLPEAPELRRHGGENSIIGQLVFTNHIKMRKPTPEEIKAMTKNDAEHADSMLQLLGIVVPVVNEDGKTVGTLPKNEPIIEEGKEYPELEPVRSSP